MGGLPRAVLVFALLVFGPAVGFSLWGWESLKAEDARRRQDLENEAQRLLDSRIDHLRSEVRRVLAAEAERPYSEFQDMVFVPGEGGPFPLFRPSPLLEEPPRDPRVRLWVQWERFPGGTLLSRPEIFPASRAHVAPQLASSFGPALELELGRLAAEPGGPWPTARIEHLPLLEVAANEERGQLREELLDWERRQRLPRAKGDPPAGGEDPPPYLSGFRDRTAEGTVTVRYGAYRLLAAPAAARPPLLLAHRWVWIPAEHADRREVRHPRLLLQGLALNLDDLLPATWERVGSAEVATLASVPAGEVVHERSLVEALDAQSVSEVLPPALRLAARVQPGVAVERWMAARNRFLLLLGGLVGVLAAGFVVLFRGLARERFLLRRKEDFMAAISHELRTPLAGIRMHAEMLREGWVADPGSAERYANRILQESERLGALVNQVMDLTALERGIVQARAVPGDLGASIREAVDFMEPNAKAAGVSLSVEIEEGLPSVTFDPRLLRSLVLNLLDNAIKYGSTGTEGKIAVHLRRGRNSVLLEVKDSGPGIDPELKRGLFEPFHRATDSPRRGLGIGLALVKRYVDAHRGRISISSAAGKGTRVQVRFPLASTPP